MIAKEYQKILKNELNYSTYLLLTLVVATLQLIKQVKLEVLAEALPLPILLESRRQKLRRFLRLEELSIETLWFPCVKALLSSMFTPHDTIYLVIDRTSNNQQVTKQKGFGTFNVACKWKRNYQGFKTKEPWYILTNFDNIDSAIQAYQKRFDIAEMFRDFKAGGYSLEGTKLEAKWLSKLMIVVAIAYTSATIQGKQIKRIGFRNMSHDLKLE